MSDTLNVIIFGDIHGRWNAYDNDYYQSLGADLILWTGDLGKSKEEGALLAQLIALNPHAYGILGNHDGAKMPLVIAEALGQDLPAKLMSKGHIENVEQLKAIMGDRDLGFAGVDLDALGLSIIGMRPHSTGGKRMHFPWTLSTVYGVDDPIARHRQNIDQAKYQDLIFIGHNGPRGLGAEPTDPFGVDFKAGGGDLGDPDYQAAIQYARSQGKRVLLAIGGHMHDLLHARSRHLGRRRIFGHLDQTPVLNACQIPRVKRYANHEIHRHHLLSIHRKTETLSIHRVAFYTDERPEEREEIYRGPLG